MPSKPFNDWPRCSFLQQTEYLMDLPDHDEPVGGELVNECEDASYKSAGDLCDKEKCTNPHRELLEFPRTPRVVRN